MVERALFPPCVQMAKSMKGAFWGPAWLRLGRCTYSDHIGGLVQALFPTVHAQSIHSLYFWWVDQLAGNVWFGI